MLYRFNDRDVHAWYWSEVFERAVGYAASEQDGAIDVDAVEALLSSDELRLHAEQALSGLLLRARLRGDGETGIALRDFHALQQERFLSPVLDKWSLSAYAPPLRRRLLSPPVVHPQARTDVLAVVRYAIVAESFDAADPAYLARRAAVDPQFAAERVMAEFPLLTEVR